jgi:hypothetical protein
MEFTNCTISPRVVASVQWKHVICSGAIVCSAIKFLTIGPYTVSLSGKLEPSELSWNRPVSVYRLGEMPIQSCGQSDSAPRGKAGATLNAHTEVQAKRQRSAREAIYGNRPIREGGALHRCPSRAESQRVAGPTSPGSPVAGRGISGTLRRAQCSGSHNRSFSAWFRAHSKSARRWRAYFQGQSGLCHVAKRKTRS